MFHLLKILYFPFNVSTDSFILEADFLFLKNLKIASYIGFRVLIDQMWQNFSQLWNILIFQLKLLESNTFELIYQGVNWRWRIFGRF